MLIMLALFYPLFTEADVVLQFDPVWDEGKTPSLGTMGNHKTTSFANVSTQHVLQEY